jgi:Na+/phosphate symporter
MLFVRVMHVVGFKADRLQTIPRAIAGFGTLLVSLTAAGVLVSQFAGA